MSGERNIQSAEKRGGDLRGTGFTGCGKTQNVVILAKRRISLGLFSYTEVEE